MTGAVFAELTSDGRDIVLVFAGEDHEQRQIAARLDRLTAAPRWDTDEYGRRTGAVLYPATWPTIVQLGFSFNAPAAQWNGDSLLWLPQDRLNEHIIAETIRRTAVPKPVSLSHLPAGLTPYPFQADNAARIAHAGAFLLLDEAGTGKTVSTILGIDARRRRGIGVFPMVIIVPSWEVADSWQEHIRTWAPDWGEPVLYGGTGRHDGQDVRAYRRVPGSAGLPLITTYDTARIDAADDRGPLTRLHAATLVLDEMHLISNPKAKRTGAARRIGKHATTLVGCSGTWVTKDAGDTYAMLETMDPRSWPSKKRMKRRYLQVTEHDYDEEITGLNPAAAEEFFATLAGQYHRYAKADVLPWLPRKIWSVLRPDIPPEWRKAYDQMESDWLAELPEGDTDLEAMDTLTRLTRLSQLASCAADVEWGERWDKKLETMVPCQIVTLRPPCWKAETLLGILAERPGQPTGVFTESRQLAMITGEYCEAAGLRTGYITGPGSRRAGGPGGPGITSKTRLQAREDFQAGRLDVIVCTAGAGGTGITLTAGNCCVMTQRPWKYDLAVQPEDRHHRPGAEIHDHVQIIDVVAKGTVDERRRTVLREKAGQLSEVVRDSRIVRELLGGKQAIIRQATGDRA